MVYLPLKSYASFNPHNLIGLVHTHRKTFSFSLEQRYNAQARNSTLVTGLTTMTGSLDIGRFGYHVDSIECYITDVFLQLRVDSLEKTRRYIWHDAPISLYDGIDLVKERLWRTLTCVINENGPFPEPRMNHTGLRWLLRLQNFSDPMKA